MCEPCLPGFKARLVREGTPQPVYRYPEAVLGDDPALRRIKRAALRLARLTTASPSRESRKDKVSRLSRDELPSEAARRRLEAAYLEVEAARKNMLDTLLDDGKTLDEAYATVQEFSRRPER